jgi:hypothetical protein
VLYSRRSPPTRSFAAGRWCTPDGEHPIATPRMVGSRGE